jgi:hypothetical protein
VNGITFHLNEDGVVQYRAEGRMKVLGLWLVHDVQSSLDACLDLLADLDDVAAGRKAGETWEGNAWRALISPAIVSLQALYSELSGSFPLSLTRSVVDRYWAFISGQAGSTVDALARWEQDNHRRHPVVTAGR